MDLKTPQKGRQCPVCSEVFSTRQFMRHKRIFFNYNTCSWEHHLRKTSRSRRKLTINQAKNPFDTDSSDDNENDRPDAEPLLSPGTPLENAFRRHLQEKAQTSTPSDHGSTVLPDVGICSQDESSLNLHWSGSDSDIAGEESAFSDTEHSVNARPLSDSDSSVTDGEEEEIEEVWEEENEDELQRDLEQSLIIHRHRSKLAKVNELVSLIVYFLLYWQASCHVSDNCLAWLLQFISTVFHIIGLTVHNDYLTELAVCLPATLYLLRQCVNLDRDDFLKKAVCPHPRCAALHDMDGLATTRNGRFSAKCCDKKRFKRGKLVACGQPLAKHVILNESVKFYPLKVFSYVSVIDSLESMLLRVGIPEKLEEWREKHSRRTDCDGSTLYTDIYDGNIWSEFQVYHGEDFLEKEGNLGLSMNVDWFQPFKNRNDYSVGVIYFAILNLPRAIRFKFENVIVAGIIPPLDQEPFSLNPFLEPFVLELQKLWKGINLSTSASASPVKVRAALLSVVSDVPAARKIGGFKSHAANLGCSKCYKSFPGGFGEKKDYSGFNRNDWTRRTKEKHNRYARSVNSCKTIKNFNNLSKKYGTYYSVLIELPYFDCVRMIAIDPMHNLFLGVGKKMFKLYLEKFLTPKKLRILQDRIQGMTVACDIGRIPHKIASNYGKFSADEWKYWITVFSMYSLHELIPHSHLLCWERFVLACKILCKPYLSEADIRKADILLVNFCIKCENLYGKKMITPNMHLMCHMRECLFDYGPISAFWCFPFERYNGYFGDIPTNNRSVEIQFMRKLTVLKFVQKVDMKSELSEQFSTLLERPGSKKELCEMSDFSLLAAADAKFMENVFWGCNKSIYVPTGYVEGVLSVENTELLEAVYKFMYPNNVVSGLSKLVKKYSSLHIFGEKFGSRLGCRTLRSARVMASWGSSSGDIDISPTNVRPCVVHWYFSHSVELDGKRMVHYFAQVRWYKPHTDKDKFGNTVQVWQQKRFEIHGKCSFLPVHRISCRFACADLKDNSQVVSAINRRVVAY